MPALVSPDQRFHRSFVAAMREEPVQIYLFDGSVDALDDPATFASYVAQLLADTDPRAPRPIGYVPATTLWWVEGLEFLGRLAIRHELNDALRTRGGHIGYWIRPSARRRGHASAALRAALPIAAALGLDPALITCDTDNLGSRRVIEGVGGRFAGQIGRERRYWVPTG